MIYIKRTYLIILSAIIAACGVLGFNYIFKEFSSADSKQIKSRYTVVIDAGHGGRDAGTSGVDGTAEKEINLAIAKRLYDFYSVSGINALLIRDGDYEYYPENSDRSRSDLYNRMDFVNSVDSSALISIHQNHFEDEREWGTQIWYSANNEESKLLADGILSAVKEFLQPDNMRENKVSDNSYYLLYMAERPSVMVECGFMSNTAENEKLKDNIYQTQMAYSILLGTCGEL